MTKGLIDDRIGHTVYMKMKKERDYYKSIADDHVKNVDYTTERIVNLKEENDDLKEENKNGIN